MEYCYNIGGIGTTACLITLNFYQAQSLKLFGTCILQAPPITNIALNEMETSRFVTMIWENYELCIVGLNLSWQYAHNLHDCILLSVYERSCPNQNQSLGTHRLYLGL